MKYKNYVNSLTGDNRIFSNKEIADMSVREAFGRQDEILAQHSQIGIPSEKELQSSDNVVHVNAYTREDGTEVKAHWRSKPGSGSTTQQVINNGNGIPEDYKPNFSDYMHDISEKQELKNNDIFPEEIAGVKKGKGMTPEQAIKSINPDYNSGEIGYKQNCAACCAIFLARLKGYDIEALPVNSENGAISIILSRNPFYAFKSPDGGVMRGRYDFIAKNSDECFKTIDDRIKTHEIHILKCSPKVAEAKFLHDIIVYKNETGKLEFYDPQRGIKLGKDFLDEIQYEGYFRNEYGNFPQSLYRVDDKKLNIDIFNQISRPAQKHGI